MKTYNKAMTLRNLAISLIARDTDRTCPFCDKHDWGARTHKAGCPFADAYDVLASDPNVEFHVEIPVPDQPDREQVAVFKNRLDAIAYCMEQFSADENGNVNLISEVIIV